MKKYMFTAKWCGNCQIMKPIVEKIAGVEIIDVEENPELVEKYTIMSLPMFITDGTPADGIIRSRVGVLPAKIIEEFYNG